MLSIRRKGKFHKLDKFLNERLEGSKLTRLDEYGKMGVEALSSSTPSDTGETARSWRYDIIREHDCIRLVFSNTNMTDGIPIVILIQYGHGTGTGAYVQGTDFINPALKPVFKQISEYVEKEVNG